jgi:hypothetical protein
MSDLLIYLLKCGGVVGLALLASIGFQPDGPKWLPVAALCALMWLAMPRARP